MMSATLRRHTHYISRRLTTAAPSPSPQTTSSSKGAAANQASKQTSPEKPSGAAIPTSKLITPLSSSSLFNNPVVNGGSTPTAAAPAGSTPGIVGAFHPAFFGGKLAATSSLGTSSGKGNLVHDESGKAAEQTTTTATEDKCGAGVRRALDEAKFGQEKPVQTGVEVAGKKQVRKSSAQQIDVGAQRQPGKGTLVDLRIDGDQISPKCISDVFHLLRANGFTVKCATYYRQGGDPKSWQERVDAFSGSFPVPVKVQVAQNVAGGLRDPGDLALAMDALEAAITYKSTHSLLGTRPLQQHCDQNASTSPTPLAPPPKLIHDGAIVSPPDAFVIVSCDLDFLPLYRRLVAQKASCYVIADAARVSDRRCADLKEVCTEVFLMNRGAGRPDNRNLVVDAAAGAGGANTSSVAAGGPAGSSCNAAALLDGTTSTQEATTSKEGGPPKTRIFGQVDHQNGVPARSSEADDATFLADTIQAGLSDGKSLRARASAVGKVLVRYGYLQRVHENETEIPLTPTAMATFLENCGIFEWRTLLGSGATTTSGTTKKGDREKVDLEGLVGLCFAKLEEMAANSSVAKAKIQPWSKQRVLAAPAADHGQRVPPLEVERPFEIFTATYKDAVAGRTVFPSKTAMFVAHVLKKLGYYQFDDIQDIRCVVEQAECESSAVLSNPNPCLIEAVDVFMVRNKYLRKKWRPIICDWVQASQDNTIAPAAGSSASVPRVLKEVLEEIYPGWTTALDGPQKVAILARLMTSTNHQRRFELAPQRASLVEFAKAGIVWPPTAGTTFVGGGSGSGEPFPVIVEQAASGNEPLTDREMLHYDAQLRTWLQKSCPSLMAVGVGTQAHDLKSSWRNFYTTLTIAHTVVRNQHNPQVRKTSPSLSLTAAVPLKNTTNITAGAVDRTETTGTNTGLGVPIGGTTATAAGRSRSRASTASITPPPAPPAASVAAHSSSSGAHNSLKKHSSTAGKKLDAYGLPIVEPAAALGRNARLPSSLTKSRLRDRGSSSAAATPSSYTSSTSASSRRGGPLRRPRRLRRKPPGKGASGRSDSRWDTEDFDIERPKTRMDEMYGL